MVFFSSSAVIVGLTSTVNPASFSFCIPSSSIGSQTRTLRPNFKEFSSLLASELTGCRQLISFPRVEVEKWIN